ncbi:MAG: hypothetical protein RI964_2354 [Pseudomonadota bacterium]
MLEELRSAEAQVELIITTPEPPKARWGINEDLLHPDVAYSLLFESGSVFQRKRATLDSFDHLYDVICHCGMDMCGVAEFYGYGYKPLAARGLYNWLHKNGALPALYVAMGEIIKTINNHVANLDCQRKWDALPPIPNYPDLPYVAPVCLPLAIQLELACPPPALAGLSKKQCLRIRRHINQQRNECVGLRLHYGWNAPPPPKTKVDIRITY